MNGKAIVRYLSLVLKLEALCMLPPLAIAVFQGTGDAIRGFLLSMALMLALSLAGDIWRMWRDRGRRGGLPKDIHTRDGFLVVALCWIAMSLFGALPFRISGEIPSLVDALFESISGFSTTGATILTNVEAMSPGLLFWRSFTHWLGGMGVLVFLLALAPLHSGEDNINVMRAESSGPSPGKLVPKLRQSSKILYGMYLGLTLAEILLLLAGGMPLYDSVVNAFGTAGTGGLAVKNASIGAYGSLYSEMVIALFMMLFGINFNIYFFLLTRNFLGIRKNDELRWYLGIVAVSTLLIAGNLTGSVFSTFPESLRYSFFQVSSVITTTGYSTADYAVWPLFSKLLLLLLALCGGCAGSTSGGLKVSRVMILLREAKRSLQRMSHPRGIGVVRLEGRAVNKRVVHGTVTYFCTFLLLYGVSTLVVAVDGFDFETTVTSVLACITNVGPGYGLVSPVGNFSQMSGLSKVVLSLDMLLGRLEIYPILLLFSTRTWRSV